MGAMETSRGKASTLIAIAAIGCGPDPQRLGTAPMPDDGSEIPVVHRAGDAGVNAPATATPTWNVELDGAVYDPGYEFVDAPASGNVFPVVPLPPRGVPAELDDICAEPAGTVSSGWAARITLRTTETGAASGEIRIAEALGSNVVGLPEADVVQSDLPWESTFTNAMPLDEDSYWILFAPKDPYTEPPPPEELDTSEQVVRIAFEIACGAPDASDRSTRRVEALTELWLCLELIGRPMDWASSGAACVTEHIDRGVR